MALKPSLWNGSQSLDNHLMRYDFSAQFIRISPPDTSFGDAWESLCYALTSADTEDRTLVRLAPPTGVSIF
jgi:hypothetical protein